MVVDESTNYLYHIISLSVNDTAPPRDTIKWELGNNGLVLISGENFDQGAICDSWMNMSHIDLNFICQELNFDQAYSYWTKTLPPERYEYGSQINRSHCKF